MDLQELLNSLGGKSANRGSIPERVTLLTEENIADLTSKAPAGKKATPAVNAAIQCIVGACIPLMAVCEDDTPAQDRLLFALTLTGACAGVEDVGSDFGLKVSVTSVAFAEAISIFRKLTGRDITEHLVPSFTRFANKADVPALS